jgi:hypothetical protein
MHTLAVYIRNSEEKRSFGKPMRRFEDNIKTYLEKMAPEKCRLDICVSERDHWWAFVNTKMEL